MLLRPASLVKPITDSAARLDRLLRPASVVNDNSLAASRSNTAVSAASATISRVDSAATVEIIRPVFSALSVNSKVFSADTNRTADTLAALSALISLSAATAQACVVSAAVSRSNADSAVA